MTDEPERDYCAEALASAGVNPNEGGGTNIGWKSGSFTAAQLQSMMFPPLSWILPNTIPAEGVTLLC